jgi:hypothetical protein
MMSQKVLPLLFSQIAYCADLRGSNQALRPRDQELLFELTMDTLPVY